MGETHERACSRRENSLKNVAVIGASGQLGTDMLKVFRNRGWSVVEVSHKDVSVEDLAKLKSFFREIKVDLIVNTAALHQVGICETEISRSWLVNATGARNVAQLGQSMDAKVVYVSTDYVFDGSKGSSYEEMDAVSPVNVYGASKAAGEVATLVASDSYLVVRISSAFGAAGSSGKGGNFVETIISKAKAGETLKVVDDMLMSPSYTVDVATKLAHLVENDLGGIFHLSNDGVVSWHEFASEICKQVGLSISIEKIATDKSQFPRRPANSSLGTEKIKELGIEQRGWKDALTSYLAEKGHLA